MQRHRLHPKSTHKPTVSICSMLEEAVGIFQCPPLRLFTPCRKELWDFFLVPHSDSGLNIKIVNFPTLLLILSHFGTPLSRPATKARPRGKFSPVVSKSSFVPRQRKFHVEALFASISAYLSL